MGLVFGPNGDAHLVDAYEMRDSFIQGMNEGWRHTRDSTLAVSITDLKPHWRGEAAAVFISLIRTKHPLWDHVPDSGLLEVCFVQGTAWPSFKQGIERNFCEMYSLCWPL